MDIKIINKEDSFIIRNKHYLNSIWNNISYVIFCLLIGGFILYLLISDEKSISETPELIGFYLVSFFLFLIAFYRIYSILINLKDHFMTLGLNISEKIFKVPNYNFKVNNTKFYSEWKKVHSSRISSGYEFYRIYLTDQKFEFVFEMDVQSFLELVEETAGTIKFIKEKY